MNGFFLAAPGGLWGLAALVAVAILYLFRRRYRPLAVTGLFLWGTPRREGMGGRKLEAPLPGRSLLLDLLAAAFFALALAGPALRRDAGAPIAIVLDDSFAMRSRDCHIEAGRLAREWLAEAGRSGVDAAVILAGAEASVLAGPGTPPPEAAKAVADGYLPSSPAGVLSRAVVLARELYGTGVEVRIVSNQEAPVHPGGDNSLVYHLLPGRGDNLALTRLWRHTGDGSGEETLTLSATNYGTRTTPARIVVTLAENEAGENAVLYAEETRVEPGTDLEWELTLADTAASTLAVRIEAAGDRDVVADDSFAYIPPSPVRIVRYGLEGLSVESARYFRLALEAAGCLPSSGAGGENWPPDLLVTGDPESAGRCLTLELSGVDNPGVFGPPYLVDLTAPLCRDLDLSGVPWVIATRAVPVAVRQTYVMAGGMPLYWRSSGERLHLNLYPERCSIVHTPAWPALVSNIAAEAARLLPGLGQSLYRPGEFLRFRHDVRDGATPRDMTLATRAGKTVSRVSRGREMRLPGNADLYRITDGDEIAGEIAVLPFYGKASDATGLSAAERVIRGGAGGANGGGIIDLTWAALVLGVLCLGANWRLGGRE